jgi:hypothetical protein
LIYITPAGPLTGTPELQLDEGEVLAMDGPPGSWIFFEISKIIHRGVPPKAGNRIILEVIIAPSFKGGVNPVISGNNAAYPLYPWV